MQGEAIPVVDMSMTTFAGPDPGIFDAVFRACSVPKKMGRDLLRSMGSRCRRYRFLGNAPNSRVGAIVLYHFPSWMGDFDRYFCGRSR